MKIFSPVLKGTTTVSDGTTNLSGSFTGSLQGTAATASYVVSSQTDTAQNTRLSTIESRTGSFATTASNAFNGSQTITGSLTATGTIVAQTLVVQTITSSVEYVSGSNRFGSTTGNTHEFTGSVLVSGSVGIGTTSPSEKLEVFGNIKLGGTSTYNSVAVYNSGSSGGGGVIAYQNNVAQAYFGAAGWYLGGATTGAIIGTDNASYPIIFSTSAERMRITGGGNVGIGTTSPLKTLHVYSDNGNGIGIGKNLTSDNISSNLYFYPSALSSDKRNWGITTYFDRPELLQFRRSSTTTSDPYDSGVTVMTLDGINDRVGIGTISPISKLQVTKGSSGNVASFTSDASATSNYSGITLNSQTVSGDDWYGAEIRNINTDGNPNFLNPRLGFFTQNYSTYLPAGRTEKMSILGNGNIGIGTTSPGAKLEIRGNSESLVLDVDSTGFDGRYALLPGRFVVGSMGNGYPEIGYNFRMTGNAYTKLGSDTAWGIDFGNSNLMRFKYASTGTGTFSFNTALTINTSGNIGIGTTSPSARLHLQGNAAYLNIQQTTTDGGILFANENNAALWTIKHDFANGHLSFNNYNASFPSLILQHSTNNVGIGLSTPAYRLHVQDSTNIGTIALGHTSYPGLIYSSAVSGEFRIDNRSSSSSGYITFYPNGQASTLGNEAMRITTTRRVGIGTTNPTHALHVDSSLRVNRTIYSWYKGSWQGNGTYWHMKTNLYAGAAGNTQYTMSFFKAFMYSYSSASVNEGAYGFHNWSGILYSPSAAGNISFSGYVSTDGYVVLVITSGSGETGVTIDWHQTYADYPFIAASVTAAGLHGSTSGKY